jgi:hypothetical protein
MEEAAFLSAGRGAAFGHSSALYRWALVEAPGREDRVERKGLRPTSVPRTLLDCLTILTSALIDQVIAMAQRRGPIKREDLPSMVARFRGHVGVRVLRVFV